MTDIICSSGEISMIIDGEEVEIGTGSVGSWSFEPALEPDESAELTYTNLDGLEFSVQLEMSPEQLEPLGLVDHLLWGSRLN